MIAKKRAFCDKNKLVEALLQWQNLTELQDDKLISWPLAKKILCNIFHEHFLLLKNSFLSGLKMIV